MAGEIEAYLSVLAGKDKQAGYDLLLELEKRSVQSDGLYGSFEDFLTLLTEKSAFVRMRGFRLCCAQAQWDTEGKWEAHSGELLALLADEKPTVVRQCLAALGEVILYRPTLCGAIEEKLSELDLSRYRDSMRPLLEKDIADLRRCIEQG